MAYAAYSEFLHEGSGSVLKTQRQSFVVLTVTVASIDALRVRRALVTCADTGIVRCTPLPCDSRVKLEIRLPLHLVDVVIHRLLDSVPSGEIGRIMPWSHHLVLHGLREGLGDGL